jgi:DNA-binding LytR/AlgR family response regulator
MGLKLKCGIVDDEQHAIDLLKYHLAKVNYLELVFETTNPVKAFELLQSQSVNLLFLDIQMTELSGLEMLKLIEGKCEVVLTTAYAEYALESYEYGVIDYLLKPITFNRFLKALQKVKNADANEVLNPLNGALPAKEFFVKSGARNNLVKIYLDTVLYIESQGNYVFFNCEKEVIKTQLPLKRIEAELATDQFMRIHQSYIVAQKHIHKLEGNCIIINDKSLPIGDKYRENVKDRVLRKTLI